MDTTERQTAGHKDTLPGLLERFAAVTVELRETGTRLDLHFAELEEVCTSLAAKGVHTGAEFQAWVGAGLATWREGKRQERDVPARVFDLTESVEAPIGPELV
jgi:hypothetical protein